MTTHVLDQHFEHRPGSNCQQLWVKGRHIRSTVSSDSGISVCRELSQDLQRLSAAGLEVFLPTASEDALGANALSFGPQVFAVFFKSFGGFFDLIAPAYQHKFSVYQESGANNVHQGLIDLFLLKTSADKKKWALLNPQAVIDYENNREFMLVEAEVGTMLDDILGVKGHSVYVRPSVGIGNDRPYDFSLEAGYKIVW